MKKGLSILLIIVLMLGMLVSCEEAEDLSWGTELTYIVYGIAMQLSVDLYSYSYALSSEGLAGITGTSTLDEDDGDLTCNLTYSNFDISTEDEDPILLNGTHERTKSGNIVTDAMNIAVIGEDMYSFEITTRTVGDNDSYYTKFIIDGIDLTSEAN